MRKHGITVTLLLIVMVVVTLFALQACTGGYADEGLRNLENSKRKKALGDELVRASFKGDLEAVKTALSRGADINYCCDYSPPGGNALILAAGRGHVSVVKYLLASGADINGNIGSIATYPTALKAGIGSGNQEVINLLKEKGAK